MPIDEDRLKSEFRGLLGPVKFRLFSLVSMPAARFAGLRMDHLDETTFAVGGKCEFQDGVSAIVEYDDRDEGIRAGLRFTF